MRTVIAVLLIFGSCPLAAAQQQSTAQHVGARPARAELSRIREEVRRKRLERRAGDLVTLSDEELEARRVQTLPSLVASELLLVVGALGVVGGVAAPLLSLECGSFGYIPVCGVDDDFLAAGLSTVAVGLVALVIGAIVLGVTQPERRRVGAAEELRTSGGAALAFDVEVDPAGGALTLRGRY